MGRKRLYHSAKEKVAANRQKSKRYYEKKKDSINQCRRAKYYNQAHKSPSTHQEGAKFTAPSTMSKTESSLKKWIKYSENIQRRLNKLTDNEPVKYIEKICLQFIQDQDKDDIHAEVVKLSTLQKRIYRCQNEILNLAGLGPEWNAVDAIVTKLHRIVGWLEEVFCQAIVGHSEVCCMYNEARFEYQQK